MSKLKPWQQHSSKWDVPWNERAENQFDPDTIKVGRASVTGLIAVLVLLPLMVWSISWGIKHPRFNENPQFNHCELVKDAKHPTGSYYSCHE